MDSKKTSMLKRVSGATGGIIFGVIWIGGWTGITMVFNVMLVSNAWQQIEALSFETEQGRILKSKLEVESDGDGDTYRPDIEFEFFIIDDRYVSNTWKFGSDMSTGSRSNNEKIVRKYPRGSEVTVYYDRDNPERAILQPGISGSELFMAWFMTPFNMIMLGSWGFAALVIYGWIRGDSEEDETEKDPLNDAEVKFTETNDGPMAKFPGRSPWIRAAAALMTGTFLGVFVLALGFGSPPSFAVMIIAWSILLGLIAIIFCHALFMNIFRPTQVLIDLDDRCIVTPHPGSLRIPMNLINDFDISTEDSDKKTEHGEFIYRPTIAYDDASQGREVRTKLPGFKEKEHAEMFNTWLMEHIS